MKSASLARVGEVEQLDPVGMGVEVLRRVQELAEQFG